MTNRNPFLSPPQREILAAFIEEHRGIGYEATLSMPCVLWEGMLNKDRYALIKQKGKRVIVSRLTCAAINGPEPVPGMHAAHGPCANTRCILHVDWKFPWQNVADELAAGTHQCLSPNNGKRRSNAD